MEMQANRKPDPPFSLQVNYVMISADIPEQANNHLIHQIIAARALEFPLKSAVQSGEDVLSYSGLMARANQVARLLRKRGLKAGDLVAIHLPRSVDMVVGILGILIAGGAYIPIDPAYPGARIRSIVKDSGEAFVLTISEFAGLFPGESQKLICLDSDALILSQFPADSLDNLTTPEDLAYILYTSGSTGQPKGVMVSHASLRNFVRLSQSALEVLADDVYLQSASIGYAVSVRQIMVALSSGATLIIASEEQSRDPLLLFEEIKRSHVTLLDVVPSFWRAVVNRLHDLPVAARSDLLANNLRRVVSVGEMLSYDIPRAWSMFGHPAQLVNIFGQTETTGIVSAHPISVPVDENQSGVVPIGKAIAETRLYIVDEHLAPVATGEMGELCISSPCLARGYLNQPDLTSAKFIPNPFHDGFSDRLYRTGDLARQSENGNIEFLGRDDSQVKIRGQRLELGEVESVLRKIPGVRDCVVLAMGVQPEERYLHAFIASADGPPAAREIRDFCRKSLPEFMVPSSYTFLDAFPLNPNGKVDRRALAAMREPDAQESAGLSNMPRDEAEERLASIWRELLRTDQVGIHDDFFDLGGHSLLAVRMFGRIEREFGIRLPLTTLFHAATIDRLATCLRDTREIEEKDSVVVPIRHGTDKPIMFGVHGHEGGVLFWRDVVMHLPDDQPFYAIQAQGVDGVQPALARIEDMAALYIRKMQRVQPHGPYFICGFSMGGDIAYEMSQQLHRMGEKVQLLVLLDTRSPRRVESLLPPGSKSHPSTEQPAKNGGPRVHGLAKKLQRHSRRLALLDASGKAGYLWMLLKTPIERFVVFRLVSLFRARGVRLPDPLLLTYLRTIHSLALHRYTPAPYPGKVTLFRSSETEREETDESSWDTLARGGLEIHRFNAPHNIVDEEYSPVVAKTLQECLIRVQGESV